MIVMILENAAPAVRGELNRWLIEPRAGVFVGHVSAMVRDRLWELCCEKTKEGGVTQMWNSNTEQRFRVRTFGETRREIVDYEGLQLVRLPLAGK
jgi:CRISPR-associated protein Cas2